MLCVCAYLVFHQALFKLLVLLFANGFPLEAFSAHKVTNIESSELASFIMQSTRVMDSQIVFVCRQKFSTCNHCVRVGVAYFSFCVSSTGFDFFSKRSLMKGSFAANGAPNATDQCN